MHLDVCRAMEWPKLRKYDPDLEAQQVQLLQHAIKIHCAPLAKLILEVDPELVVKCSQ